MGGYGWIWVIPIGYGMGGWVEQEERKRGLQPQPPPGNAISAPSQSHMLFKNIFIAKGQIQKSNGPWQMVPKISPVKNEVKSVVIRQWRSLKSLSIFSCPGRDSVPLQDALQTTLWSRNIPCMGKRFVQDHRKIQALWLCPARLIHIEQKFLSDMSEVCMSWVYSTRKWNLKSNKSQDESGKHTAILYLESVPGSLHCTV